MALRRIAFRVLVPLLAATAGLLAAEAVLRVLDHPPEWSPVVAFADENGTIERPWHEVFVRRAEHPLLDYELIPGRTTYLCYKRPWPDYFDRDGRVAHRVNRHGLRDVEFDLKPRTGTHRVLCLGDSFTVGFGVPLEHSFPKQLERLLGEHHPGRVFQVVNAGFAAGPEIKGHVAFLLARGLSVCPRIVILTVCLNDVADVPMAVEHLTWTDVPLQSRFRLARLVSYALTGLRARWLAGDPERCDALCPPRDAIALWRESLELGSNFCRDQGLRFLVVVYPMMCDFEGSYPWIRIHERVVAHCRAKGIDVEDLLPAFGGRNGRALWVHPSDQHPNPAGHAIAARAVLAALERRGWIP